ncbi:hypothetical protein GN244_ATG11999 [Phytophthora infestans]|nr:hypothetical protein GN244_ATG11999 [Phytophthora infestans]
MRSTGEMLTMRHIVELQDSRALEFCAHPPEEYKSYGPLIRHRKRSGSTKRPSSQGYEQQ